MTCKVSELPSASTRRALRLENEYLYATVLVDKGADIYELVYKPCETDVLWKSPGSRSRPAYHGASSNDSQTAWLEAYPGGWQELFPNAGPACRYRGVELSFHGEASMRVWDCEILEANGSEASLRCSVRLRRTPFYLERTMRLRGGEPVLFIDERIVNQGGEQMEYMWGHHPAFGAPFISPACRIDTSARTLTADDETNGPHSPLDPGEVYSWPEIPGNAGSVDLSRVPGPGSTRELFAYLQDFETGWYAITNRELGWGIGLRWPVDTFPYAWFWQEMNASDGFPWYSNTYVMALEPFSSIPGRGLQVARETTDTVQSLAPGEAATAQLRVVFYEGTGGVEHIDSDGSVITRS